MFRLKIFTYGVDKIENNSLNWYISVERTKCVNLLVYLTSIKFEKWLDF